jgi:hypothetical protein
VTEKRHSVGEKEPFLPHADPIATSLLKPLTGKLPDVPEKSRGRGRKYMPESVLKGGGAATGGTGARSPSGALPGYALMRRIFYNLLIFNFFSYNLQEKLIF